MLNDLYRDLRDRRLLPVVIVLAVAIVATMRPDLFTIERMYGDVETDGTLTYGATVFDRRRRPECQPNMDVAIDMDTAAVADCIVRGLAQVA